MNTEITKKADKKGDSEISKYMQKKYVSIAEGAELYSMGTSNFRRLAQKAGALYRVGEKRILINTQIFEGYLERFRVQS